MQGWITADRFAEVLTRHGFDVVEEDGWFLLTRGTVREPYKLRDSRMVPPKVYERLAFKYGIEEKEFRGDDSPTDDPPLAPNREKSSQSN